MNGWDLFTWINAAGLLIVAVVVFGYSLRDAREMLKREGRDKERGPI